VSNFFRAVVEQLRSSIVSLTARVSTLEKGCSQSSSGATQPSGPAAKKDTEAVEDADDDDFELFGSDDDYVFHFYSSIVLTDIY